MRGHDQPDARRHARPLRACTRADGVRHRDARAAPRRPLAPARALRRGRRGRLRDQPRSVRERDRRTARLSRGVVARGAVAAVPAALAGLTALAAALRFAQLGHVQGNPFYDAAVRTMSRSWHAFFFGAFEPGGSVSVDKPPVDLWLQVASVKLFGFTPTALKLPQALAGTLSVPLLYHVVRRGFGRGAGLVAAAAMAVLLVEVITA